jgi:hypothetical protein
VRTNLSMVTLGMSNSGLLAYRRLPLDISKRDYRILHLLPGTHGDIHCTLQRITLGDFNHPYACVSYVWGDATVTKPIRVDDEELQITLNLFDFLHHIRHLQDTIILWVDSICMNQNNAEEKSHQVKLMGEIYSRCSIVHVWLGRPQAPIRTDPFQLIRHFAEGKHYHELPGYSRDCKNRWMFDQAKFVDLWEAFLLVADSPWWTRAWTVQEIVLPSRSIMWCGTWNTPYDTISLAKKRRNNHLGVCCAQSLIALSNPLRRRLDFFLGEVERIDHVHHYHHTKDRAHLLSETVSSLAAGPPTFPEILVSFASRECKDPRDKIYSLLGLAQHSMLENYRPQYQDTVATCYTEIFQRILDADGKDYRPLIGHGFFTGNPELPSWVRDFSQVISQQMVGTEIRRLRVYDLFNSSGGRTGNLKVKEEKELHTTGIRADTIIEVGPPIKHFQAGGDTIKVPLAKWTRLCEQAISSEDKVLVRRTLSRAICGGLNHDLSAAGCWRRHRDSDAPSETAWKQFLDGNVLALDNSYEAAVELTTANRSLYMTQAGKIGICNPRAQSGDEVWALCGSRIPFVLRKVSERSSPRDPYRCYLIGDCFLLDAMDGEIVESSQSEERVVIV